MCLDVHVIPMGISKKILNTKCFILGWIGPVDIKVILQLKCWEFDSQQSILEQDTEPTNFLVNMSICVKVKYESAVFNVQKSIIANDFLHG